MYLKFFSGMANNWVSFKGDAMKKELVILSGWAVDTFVWSPLCDMLSDHYNITLIQWNDVDSFDRFKDKIIDILNEKQIGKFTLMGWSLGSLAAMDLASTHTSCIEQIILFSGTGKFIQDESTHYHPGWPKRIVRQMIRKLGRDPQVTLNAFYQSLFTTEEIEQGYFNRFLEESRGEVNVDALTCGLEYLIRMDTRDIISEMKIPVLLIHGRDDNICPLQAGKYIDRSMTNAHMTILEKTGHVPFFTKTDPCYKIIKKHVLCIEE